MKVLFVMTNSMDDPAGFGRFGPIAKQLVKKGFHVEIIGLHPNYKNVAQKRFNENGVDVHYVAQMHVKKHGSIKEYFHPLQLVFVVLWAILRQAYYVFRSDAELIQLCKPQPINVLAVRIGSRGRPIYCDCDDYEAASNNYNGRFQKHIVQYFEDSIIHFVKGITTNTTFTKQRYEKLGFAKESIIHVGNGIERDRFNISTKKVEELKQQLNILD